LEEKTQSCLKVQSYSMRGNLVSSFENILLMTGLNFYAHNLLLVHLLVEYQNLLIINVPSY